MNYVKMSSIIILIIFIEYKIKVKDVQKGVENY